MCKIQFMFVRVKNSRLPKQQTGAKLSAYTKININDGISYNIYIIFILGIIQITIYIFNTHITYIVKS